MHAMRSCFLYITHVYVKYPYNLMNIGVADRNIVSKNYYRCLSTIPILNLLRSCFPVWKN